MPLLDRLLYVLTILPIQWLIKPRAIPTDLESELGIDATKPIIYLLKTRSVSDLLALNKCAAQLGLPKSTSTFKVGDKTLPRTMCLRNPNSVFKTRVIHTDIKHTATELFYLHGHDPELDIQIVPVTILWGRAPDKTFSGWSDVLANQMSPSWLRKLFIVLFLGRNNFVCFSQAVSSKQMSQLPGSDQQIAQKLIRVAGTHFYRKNQAIKGPNLLDKQALYNGVLGAKAIGKAISNEAKATNISPQQAKNRAKRYLDEIAADYRPGLIRIGDKLLTKLWNKVYNGIEVHHAAEVRALAESGHEIVYVPCHRSHMDYLLLTYVIYQQGLVTPHIAAGINLNFKPVGGLLRKAGAFYIRRSFAGQPLYAAIFREYLEMLFNKGYSVKFFPEGGRSRTGRLLPPKTGMFAMTVQSLLNGINRPVSIVPVYIGYDHVMEISSYLKELKGASKKKNLFGKYLAQSKKLKNYGVGHLSFGQPLNLASYLDQVQPHWRDASTKPKWLTPVVNDLANEVMNRVNQTTAVSNMAIIATCLLAAPRHAMSKTELASAITHLLALLQDAPFSERLALPSVSASEVIQASLKLNKLTTHSDSYGDIIAIKPNTAVPLTYYRNNIQHLFVLPSLLTALVAAHSELDELQLIRRAKPFVPLLKAELFIYMDSEQSEQYLEQLVHSMLQSGLLAKPNEFLCLPDATHPVFSASRVLTQSIQDTLNRYAVVLSIMEFGKANNQRELEQHSRQFAQRLSALHGLGSPEFFDSKILNSLITALVDQQFITHRENDGLHTTETGKALLQQTNAMISPDIVQRLAQI